MSMPYVCHFVAVAAANISGWSIRTTQKNALLFGVSRVSGRLHTLGKQQRFRATQISEQKQTENGVQGAEFEFLRSTLSPDAAARPHHLLLCAIWRSHICDLAHVFVWHGSSYMCRD